MRGEREPLIRAVRLDPARIPAGAQGPYPWTLPAVVALAADLELDTQVTLLVGANGAGKSTVLEAMAVAAARVARRATPTRPGNPTRR